MRRRWTPSATKAAVDSARQADGGRAGRIGLLSYLYLGRTHRRVRADRGHCPDCPAQAGIAANAGWPGAQRRSPQSFASWEYFRSSPCCPATWASLAATCPPSSSTRPLYPAALRRRDRSRHRSDGAELPPCHIESLEERKELANEFVANLDPVNGSAAMLAGVLLIAADLLSLASKVPSVESSPRVPTPSSPVRAEARRRRTALARAVRPGHCQTEAAGAPGLAGFIAAFAGTVLMAGRLLGHGLLGADLGKLERRNTSMPKGPRGRLANMFVVSWAVFIFGWLLFALRARIYPRVAAVLLIVGAVPAFGTLSSWFPTGILFSAADLAWATPSGRRRMRRYSNSAAGAATAAGAEPANEAIVNLDPVGRAGNEGAGHQSLSYQRHEPVRHRLRQPGEARPRTPTSSSTCCADALPVDALGRDLRAARAPIGGGGPPRWMGFLAAFVGIMLPLGHFVASPSPVVATEVPRLIDEPSGLLVVEFILPSCSPL